MSDKKDDAIRKAKKALIKKLTEESDNPKDSVDYLLSTVKVIINGDDWAVVLQNHNEVYCMYLVMHDSSMGKTAITRLNR